MMHFTCKWKLKINNDQDELVDPAIENWNEEIEIRSWWCISPTIDVWKLNNDHDDTLDLWLWKGALHVVQETGQVLSREWLPQHFLGKISLGERIGQGNAWCTCTPNKNQNSTCSQYSMTRNILSKLLPTAISFILTMFSCSILEIRVSSMWKYRLWSHWLKPTQEEWRSPWGQTRASHPSPSPSSSSSGQQLLRTLCPGLCTQSHRYPHPPDR